jgi:hypothetical protein
VEPGEVHEGDKGMILHCNFEELGALNEGATALLGEPRGGDAPVAAPPEGREEVGSLVRRLTGDLTIETLAEQREVAKAVGYIVDHLRDELDLSIVETHPADESAVASYFLFAHALAVMNRVVEMGQEMEALIGVVTRGGVTDEAARSFLFPS